jgi:C_GCAxxG_C_C family probable redox protein
MKTKQQQALETFNNNYNCAQSVFSAFAPELGLSREQALKIANNFGAGIVYMQQTCGAVTGALMAIGLKYGKGENGTNDDKEMANDLAHHFVAEFKKAHHHINCRQLLQNADISTPEGMTFIQEHKLFDTHCPRYVKDAVEIVSKILR